MKKIVVLFAEGFEEVEALSPVDVLRRLNLPVITATINDDLMVKGALGVYMQMDAPLANISPDEVDAVILPGGMPGSRNLRDSLLVINFLQRLHEKGALICAICAAPTVLERAGIVAGKKLTCYPGFESEIPSASYDANAKVVEDGQLITGRGPGVALDFAFAIASRFVEEAQVKALRAGMQYDL